MTEETRSIKDITLSDLMEIFTDADANFVHFRNLALPLTQTDRIGAALVGAFLATEAEQNSVTIEALLDILDAARFWCTMYARIAHSQVDDAPAPESDDLTCSAPLSEGEQVSENEETVK